MSPFKDLVKIVNGVALVAIEATKRSEPIAAIRGGDLQTLVPKTLKSALTSATDITGLTKGSPREVSAPKVRKSSVVYFTDPKHDSDDVSNVAARSESVVKAASIEDNEIGVVAVEEEVKIEHKLEDRSGKVENAVQNLSEKVEEKAEFMNHKVVVNENVEVLNVVDEKKESKNEKVEVTMKKRRPRERRVPSTPFTRLVGFAGLGAGLAWGTVQESAKRIVYGTPTRDENQPAYSAFLSDQNAERLALALCRMRGAALKLGQMLSIQDESLVPAPILAALEIVRQGADVMPRSQLNEVLNAELGPDWPTKLWSFDYEPLAAASIGQVHRAVLKNGMNVAMKIQYPGVADSIESDIENVRRLLNYTNLIPEGLYLDSAIKVAKEELARECNYILEAQSQKRFRELLSDSKGFYVPEVVDEVSSLKVLTTELVSGVPIDNVALLNQETRNYVGTKLLELTLKELFLFRFMQTDPNWSNFLYDDKTKMINLIDFGAARDYPQNFVDDYLRMVMACANKDRDAVIKMSKRLGFLTGDESEVMLDAHVQAGFIVGIPFSTDKEYDFRSTNITHSISNLGATMLKHRLTPPPDEAYSLHRKLSGAFLACIKLKAVVPCRQVLMQIYQKYQFTDDDAEFVTTSAS